MAYKSQYAGPGGWNDPDFLMTGDNPSMGDADYTTEFSFWCLLNAPLIVSTDVRDLSNKQQLLNKEAIAVNQDPLAIAGDIRSNQTDGGQVWSKQLSGGQWAVILYNSNIWFDSATPLLQFTSSFLVGWPAAASSATLRDIWAQKDLGQFKGSYSLELPVHEVQMLIVTPVT